MRAGFIKKDQLVLLIDQDYEMINSIKSLLSTLRFKGQIQTVKTLAKAILFLNSVQNKNGQNEPANLVFASYDSSKQGNVVELIEKLANQDKNKIKDAEQEPRVLLP